MYVARAPTFRARKAAVQRRANRDYYDEFAAGYENERHHGYHALIDRLELAAVRPYALQKRVLEAGCGTGMI